MTTLQPNLPTVLKTSIVFLLHNHHGHAGRWYQLERHCHDCTSQPGQHSGQSAQQPTWHRQAFPVRRAWALHMHTQLSDAASQRQGRIKHNVMPLMQLCHPQCDLMGQYCYYNVWCVGRVIYGSAGVELGREIATGNVWPDPPQPCGIIAGTRSLSMANPTSWLTTTFGMISGKI